MNNQNNKKVLLTVMFVAILTIAVIGTSFAFFNYTRTGSSNTVKTGTINFASSQSGTFNLTNVFPIATGDVLSDSNNSQEVVITISGDTTYSQGIEYLVTLEDVNVRTNTYKKVPVGLMVTPEKTGELGTSDNAYFTNRGGSTSIYKSFIGQSDILEDGQYVLVGYIRPGEAEVNGTIGIRAFIDKDSIAITDTPEENTEWQNGRMVLSTSEWNSLQTNGITFKVRVVANEGVWVGEPTSRNDLKNFSSTLTSAQKSSITEINFIRMSEEMIDTHANLIDLKASGGQGVVKGWIENNKLYIASPGVTYFPSDSSSLFSGYTNVTKISFNNVNTSNVSRMDNMFQGCSSLTNLDLSSFDTRNVTEMYTMFQNCSSLENVNLSSFDTSKVNGMMSMFSNCSSLKSIDLSNFETPMLKDYGISSMFSGCTNIESVNLSGLGSDNITSISGLFSGCSNLKNINMSNFNFGKISSLNSSNYSPFYNLPSVKTINLNNANTNNITDMTASFYGCTNLENLYLSNINTLKVTQMMSLFQNCSSLKILDLSSFDTSNLINYGMASMFYGCSSLETIYVSNLWNSSNQNSSGIFSGNTLLVGGNGTVFDSSKVDKTVAVIDTPKTPGYLTEKKMSYTTNAMGYFPSSITNEKSSITKVIFTRMSQNDMQKRYNAAYPRADITYNNEGKVLTWVENNILYIVSDGITYLTNGNGYNNDGLFGGFNNVETYVFNNIDTSRITNMHYMFSLNYKITNIDFSKFDTSNVTDMSYMFYGSNKLSNLDLGSFDTSKVTNMGYMFLNCNALININLSSFNTSNVTTMEYMFSGCKLLSSLNISHFNTSKVTRMSYMFRQCEKLPVIDISGFGNSNLQYADYMFEGCTSLSAVYMNNFNFGKVSLGPVFANSYFVVIYLNNATITGANNSAATMFSGLSNLRAIYMIDVDISSITNMYSMFSGSKNLTKIYVSNSWNTNNVSESEKMFSNCTSLVGGNGTVYDSTKTDKTMAVIDTASTPGYLSLQS